MEAWLRKPSLNFALAATCVSAAAKRPFRFDEQCANLPLMRSMQIILVLIALVLAPLALLARSEACADACSKSCCVAFHHSASGPAPSAAHCHGNNRASSARCCDEPTSNHALDYGFSILMPLSILPNNASLAAPAISRSMVVTNLLISPSVFSS